MSLVSDVIVLCPGPVQLSVDGNLGRAGNKAAINVRNVSSQAPSHMDSLLPFRGGFKSVFALL